MCPGPERQKESGHHLFIRNERWENDVWVQMAGTRLPDNKANRRKLANDIEAMTKSGMRARTVRYEVLEEILGVLFGEGASEAEHSTL